MILKNKKTELLFEELEENKKNVEYSKEILEEINNRLNDKTFSFNTKNIDYIYIYMFSCNKYSMTEELNKLINNEEFIKLLEKTDIDGSIILSLTSNCHHPRTNLLNNSKKIKTSILKEDRILSTSDILCDLTKEEIELLREDLSIDNYLISKGLSFDTLKPETTKKLLENIESFSVYNIKTISDFANGYKKIKDLASNKGFLKIYISKLDNDYTYQNNIFKFMNLKELKNIINQDSRDCVIYHIIREVKPDIQNSLLQNKIVSNAIYECNDNLILKALPSGMITNILLKKNLSENDLPLLNYLTKKDIEKLFNTNKEIYNLFIENINSGLISNLEYVIESLPNSYYKDFSTIKIKELDLTNTIKILKSNNKLIKKIILNNSEYITKLVNNSKNYKDIIELFEVGEFNSKEKTKFILDIKEVKDDTLIARLVENIPACDRKDISKNKNIRNILLNDFNYILDENLIEYLKNNIDELKKVDTIKILTILNNSEPEYIRNILESEEIINKIILDNTEEIINEVIEIAASYNCLNSIISKKAIINNCNLFLVNAILKHLDIKDKNKFCTQEIMQKILSSNAYDTYTKLLNKNSHILNTLNFVFLNDNYNLTKMNVLEKITKYPLIQEYIVRISKYFKLNKSFYDMLYYDMGTLDFETTVTDCLGILCESCEGKNRKYIGNIPKIMNELNKELTKEDYLDIIKYILCIINRNNDKKADKLNKNMIIEAASTYQELKDFEYNLETKLTELINNNEDTMSNFIYKHFKLSLEDANTFINAYSIENIDKKIYKEEYEYINNLNNIIEENKLSLSNLDKTYKTYSIFESFNIEEKIKNMYSKIYNYEIKCKVNANKSYVQNDTCQKLKIYNCPSEFLFLVSNIDLTEYLNNSTNYFEAWHSYVDKNSFGIKANLISNENLRFTEDFLFGFDGVAENGIRKMSNINISLECQDKTKEKYMTPKELINNTRDYNNTIILDRYAIRPNYNNSNIPNIEPDFMLVDKSKLDNTSYLEKIMNISSQFVTKRNKNGLPLIAIDIDKIATNEENKINELYAKYSRNRDNTLLESILTRLENNYCAYQDNASIITKFSILNILAILKLRVESTSSIKELNTLEEIFTKEFNKFDYTKVIPCNFDINEIKKMIAIKKSRLGK